MIVRDKTILIAIFAITTTACMADSESLGIAEQESDTSVMFYENFFSSGGDAGQCGGRLGVQSAAMGSWTLNVDIDADHRVGGCEQQFAVTDPEGLVPGLALNVNFFADGDAGQCTFPGSRPIPVVNASSPEFSSVYGIDTDGRPGGCWQVFSLAGRSDIVLDVEFLASGNPGQCNNAGLRTVTSQVTASFRIDTDDRSGGCTERFRLRRP